MTINVGLKSRITFYILLIIRKKPHIFCLQESHAEAHLERNFLETMQYDLCFGNNTSHCGGLITGFDRKLN